MQAWGRPTWQTGRVRESLRELAGWLNARARETFLEDGAHAELFFFIRHGGDIQVELAPPGLARDHLLEMVWAVLRDPAVVGLVHIFEAWTYVVPNPLDPTQCQLRWGALRVSELPPEDRREALMVTLLARDGDAICWCNPIRRDEDAPPMLDAVTCHEDGPHGPWGRLFDPAAPAVGGGLT